MSKASTRKTKQQSKPGTITDRQAWLNQVAGQMSNWFEDLGFPLPAFQVASGFPSSGQRGSNTAEVWQDEGESSFTIFVRPDRSDSQRVAAAIAHQMAHMAAGSRDSHGHLFRHIAVSIGLRGRATEASPGRLFKELVEPVLHQAGALPTPLVGPSERALKSKQTTRLIKVSCSKCGYLARVARKWIDDVGPPHCPRHGAMRMVD